MFTYIYMYAWENVFQREFKNMTYHIEFSLET